MKYVSLMSDQHGLGKHPLANRINDIMHDGLNDSCVNYLDLATLRNRLGPVNPNALHQALEFLIAHHYLIEQHYHGKIIFSVN